MVALTEMLFAYSIQGNRLSQSSCLHLPPSRAFAISAPVAHDVVHAGVELTSPHHATHDTRQVTTRLRRCLEIQIWGTPSKWCSSIPGYRWYRGLKLRGVNSIYGCTRVRTVRNNQGMPIPIARFSATGENKSGTDCVAGITGWRDVDNGPTDKRLGGPFA